MIQMGCVNTPSSIHHGSHIGKHNIIQSQHFDFCFHFEIKEIVYESNLIILKNKSYGKSW